MPPFVAGRRSPARCIAGERLRAPANSTTSSGPPCAQLASRPPSTVMWTCNFHFLANPASSLMIRAAN